MGDLLKTLQSNPFVQSLETILHGSSAPTTSSMPAGQVSQAPIAISQQPSTPTASINQLPSQGGVVSQAGYNLSPQGIKATLQKGGNTPVVQELAGKEGPNAQAVAGMGIIGDADMGGFRPVKPGEVLPEGYTTKLNMSTGEQVTNAPDTTQIIDPKTGQPIVKPEAPQTPQNGGQYVNPDTTPLKGGTTAQVQARPKRSPNLNYTPPSSESDDVSGGSATLNPNAETFNNNQSSAQAPSKPFPDVPDQPAIVTDRQNPHPVTGGNPVRLDFSDQAKKNNFYLSDQTKAQNVLDKYVAGDTPLEVQSNLPRQQEEESQRIKNIIADNPSGITDDHPAPITKQSLIDENTKAMQKQGIELGDDESYDSTNKALLKKLDNQLNPGTTNIIPNETLTGNNLQDYIKTLDPTLQSAYKKLDNGTTLTSSEKAALTMRRTASSMLKSRYPNAGEALDRQSAMYDASPYVAKEASAEMKAQNESATKAQQETTNRNAKIPPFLRGIATLAGKQPTWLKYAEGGAAATLGINELGKLPSQIGTLAGMGESFFAGMNQKKAQPASTSSSTKPMFSTTTPLDDGTIISKQEQYARQAALTKRMGSGMTGEENTNPGQYSKDYAEYTNNQNQFNLQADLRSASQDTKTVDMAANNAAQAANDVDQGFFQALSKGYNSAEIQTNPKYASLAGYLSTLQQYTKVPLNYATSKEALIAGIKAAYQAQQNTLNVAKTTYYGGSKNQAQTNQIQTQQNQPTVQPSQAPLNWQQHTPAANAILSTGGAGGGGTLPPFDQLFR